MRTTITLSDFEGQALSDMSTLNSANTKALEALDKEISELDREIEERQARADSIAKVIEDRERRITEGIETAHGVSIPKTGTKLDKDKDGRYVISWDAPPKKKAKKAKKKTARKKAKRK